LVGLERELSTWRQNMEFIFNPPANFLSFAERRGDGNGWYAKAVPVEIGELLAKNFFSRMEAVVLTSATLTVAGNFNFFLKRWGLYNSPALVTARLESPFDFSRQAIIGIPKNFQRYAYPDHPDLFVTALAEGIKHTAKTLRGKELALFSSRVRMEKVYLKVREDLQKEGIMVFCQGIDGSRSHLMEILKESGGDLLLFGSRSFQEGIDIPGLRAVIIEKIPFPSKSDPLVVARQKAIASHGGEPFSEYILPLATLSLKQSIGRLIRSKADRGVIIIFDMRLLNDFSKDILDSLPEATKIIEDVPLFYEKLAAACRLL